MDLERKKRIQSWSVIAIFCGLIYGFGTALMIKTPSAFSETENRVLRQRPNVEWEAIVNGSFEEDYEEYLTDQFVLRDRWIGMKTFVEKLCLKSESKDIYFARDDYLIEKHTGVFTTDLAERNIQTLAEMIDNYYDRFKDGHMTVMIVPNAVDILEDKLPAFASPCDEELYLEKAASLLPEGVWMDASSVLRNHAEEELYYKTDHHWRTLAAFYVYQEWAKRQGDVCPDITDYKIRKVTDSFEGTIQSKLGIRTGGDRIELFLPAQESFYTVSWDGEEHDSLYDYGALETKDQYGIYFGGNHSLVQIRTAAESGRSILVIKDSYANCFIPFMLKEFDVIDVIDFRYTNSRLSELVEEGGYSDLLILYNAAGFAEDMNIRRLIN